MNIKTKLYTLFYSHTSMLFAPAQPACVGRHVKSLVPVGLAVEITLNYYHDGNASLHLIVCSAQTGKLNNLRPTLDWNIYIYIGCKIITRMTCKGDKLFYFLVQNMIVGICGGQNEVCNKLDNELEDLWEGWRVGGMIWSSNG